MRTLFTIGYEGAALPDFVASLQLNGVQHVLDVRQLAQSRRPGFSKTALAAALNQEGIGYSHQRQLGDPKPGRMAAREGRMDDFYEIFETHLLLPETQLALEDAASLCQAQPTALMCFERDHRSCHRTLVAGRLKGLCSLSVRHIGVVKNARDCRPVAEAA